jgi:hypothetical protein
MSESRSRYLNNLSEEEKEKYREVHRVDTTRRFIENPDCMINFKKSGSKNMKAFHKKLSDNPKLKEEYNKKRIESYKKNYWAKTPEERDIHQKFQFDEYLLNLAVKYYTSGLNELTAMLKFIKEDPSQEFLSHYRKLNESTKGKFEIGNFTHGHLVKLLKFFGYKNATDFKSKVAQYNHKVTKIEYLSETMDTGTLTIDGNEKYHNYHTFALASGVFVFNSNLSDIMDLEYFRRKFYVGLRVPSSYLAHEDEVNRATLVQQDVHFARLIQRFQYAISEGLEKVAILQLYAFHTGMSERAEDLRRVKTLLDKYRISFKWTTASFIEENARYEGLKLKAEVAQSLVETFGENSKKFVVKSIYQLTPEEEELLLTGKEMQTPSVPEIKEPEIGGGSEGFGEFGGMAEGEPGDETGAELPTPEPAVEAPAIEEAPAVESVRYWTSKISRKLLKEQKGRNQAVKTSTLSCHRPSTIKALNFGMSNNHQRNLLKETMLTKFSTKLKNHSDPLYKSGMERTSLLREHVLNSLKNMDSVVPEYNKSVESVRRERQILREVQSEEAVPEPPENLDS